MLANEAKLLREMADFPSPTTMHSPSHTHTHTLSCAVQVFICHDNDTGRELAVKAVNVDHIDHAGPSHNSREMLKV